VSRTPAAELARVKATYPAWSIRRVNGGEGFTAHRGGDRIHARTLGELEHELMIRFTPGPARQEDTSRLRNTN